MPTYEYQCDKCGEIAEYFQAMSEPPKTTCEKCGGKLTKLLSAGSGLIFKGSGFYITDYKKSGASGEPSESKPAEKKSEGAAPSTESKSSTSESGTSGGSGKTDSGSGSAKKVDGK